MMTMNNWERLRAVHDKLIFDLPPDITLTDADTDIIENALKKSRWLRTNVRSLWRLYKWLPRLESGYYDDYINHDLDSQWGDPTYDLNNLFTYITGDEAPEKE